MEHTCFIDMSKNKTQERIKIKLPLHNRISFLESRFLLLLKYPVTGIERNCVALQHRHSHENVVEKCTSHGVFAQREQKVSELIFLITFYYLFFLEAAMPGGSHKHENNAG